MSVNYYKKTANQIEIKEVIDSYNKICLAIYPKTLDEFKELANLCDGFILQGGKDYTDLEVMEMVGNKRGCKVGGGEIDYTKTANIIIDEFRKAIIGNITLERPGE